MNNNYTQTEQLIQYLDGELETASRQQLEAKLASEPALAAELESLSLTQAAVRSYGLKSRIGSIHKEMMKELVTEETPVVRMTPARIFRYTARIAAILLLVVGVTVLFQYYTASNEQIFRDNFAPFELRTSRGAGVESLEQQYQKGDYAAVVSNYKNIASPSQADRFLYANAALQTNDAAAAIAALTALQDANKTAGTHAYEEDAEYYLALAYLKNNEAAKALPLLKKIHEDAGHTYHDKVSGWMLRKAGRLAK
jgi:hypothetical protein